MKIPMDWRTRIIIRLYEFRNLRHDRYDQDRLDDAIRIMIEECQLPEKVQPW